VVLLSFNGAHVILRGEQVNDHIGSSLPVYDSRIATCSGLQITPPTFNTKDLSDRA
jgi:hypothetical protein